MDAAYHERDEAPAEMVSAVEELEERFQIRFDTLACFPKALFAALHALSRVPPDLPSSVVVASQRDHNILKQIEVFVRVANTQNASTEARREYLGALLEIYRRLPRDPALLVGSTDTLCVGIEREGAMLAEALHRLPAGRSIRPHAKRLLFEGGLVVGMRGVKADRTYRECMITDGAIASGATLIATMHMLKPWVRSFHIFSAHSSWQGIVGLCRYADQAGVQLRLTVGHATPGMNKKYYATLPGSEERLVLGDVGDTISEVS